MEIILIKNKLQLKKKKNNYFKKKIKKKTY